MQVILIRPSYHPCNYLMPYYVRNASSIDLTLLCYLRIPSHGNIITQIH